MCFPGEMVSGCLMAALNRGKKKNPHQYLGYWPSYRVWLPRFDCMAVHVLTSAAYTNKTCGLH